MTIMALVMANFNGILAIEDKNFFRDRFKEIYFSSQESEEGRNHIVQMFYICF
jgi:hypothetical protein